MLEINCLFNSKQLRFVGESEFYKNVTAFQVEFLADIGAVSFPREVTDEKLFTDFLIDLTQNVSIQKRLKSHPDKNHRYLHLTILFKYSKCKG